MPRNDSVRWIEKGKRRFLRFQVEDKHYDGCSTDRMVRHGAPYWERAEVKQINSLTKNVKYELKFQVRFVEGYAGNRENFWQMHVTNSPCNIGPAIMIKISDGKLMLAARKNRKSKRTGRYSGSNNHYSTVTIDDLLGKWNIVKMLFDTSENPEVSLYLNNKEIFSDIPYRIETCGVPHFKFGIYRPGNKSKKNNRSIVDFDKIKLSLLGASQNKNSFCLKPNTNESIAKVYRVSDKCADGHEPISFNQYYKIKKIVEEGGEYELKQ